ncbi:MAG: histidine phosphatase family protein [Acidimicrobiia bacterium]|nr:histidine phosphatase family protein [Acidimicrobiia bacterium]
MASMIHLIRHGEVENPKHLVYADLPGFGLSELGRLQAKESARYLASRPVVAVWSSPLERAIETAQFIAARHQLPVRIDEALTEWQLSSRWSGIRWDDLPNRMPGELEAYLANPWELDFAPETLAELADRMAEVTAELAGRYRDGDVVVVSHQDPIQAARLHLAGADLRRLNIDKPGHASVVSLRPGTPWTELNMWEPDLDPPSVLARQ